MKQVTVLAALSAPADLFDEATADIETFNGVNYLIVRRADPSSERVNRELLAAFSTFHSFRIDDTEGSPALKVANEKIDYLYDVITNANKEVLERDQIITDLKTQLASLVEAKIIPPALEAPRKPLVSHPVAMPPLADPTPWPKIAQPERTYPGRVDSGETVNVPYPSDEAYACEPDPKPTKDEPSCQDSSATKAPPTGKKR